MSVITVEPGKWKIRYHALDGPISTASCMKALEKAMKASPLDVFWLQDRWKLYIKDRWPLTDWLGPDAHGKGTPHRALLWRAGVPEDWKVPENWTHPDVTYEIIEATAATDRDSIQKFIAEIDRAKPLPIDFILTCNAPKALVKAAKREGIPLISLKPQP